MENIRLSGKITFWNAHLPRSKLFSLLIQEAPVIIKKRNNKSLVLIIVAKVLWFKQKKPPDC